MQITAFKTWILFVLKVGWFYAQESLSKVNFAVIPDIAVGRYAGHSVLKVSSCRTSPHLTFNTDSANCLTSTKGKFCWVLNYFTCLLCVLRNVYQI